MIRLVSMSSPSEHKCRRSFAGAVIPVSRFFPVKTCNDLLAVRSDRLVFTEDNNLILNPNRRSDNINIDLDPRYFGKIDLFDERFVDEAPSLIDCESLTIKGDIRLESNVTIKGRVVIKNSGKSQAVIKAGVVIDADVTFS